ncbi:DedA family protein [Heyndrickxia acidicola]|uniref:DedA family protein n=1 Tax=Heyndrickxia acidicola TaxID=209389 RepID=A0ABU6MIZ4_9BACI|nr:DedA family protein [Heyndrickxia acidicola]MED1204634.1 DedA family protein [Heyndrickxia acidicola]
MSGIVHHLLTTLVSLGYFGIALGLMVEIIPSEIVLAYAGYLVSKGEVNFAGAVIAGTIGALIAQLILYWIGAYGGRPFLRKYGKYLFIHEKHIDLADEWFKRYGAGVVFTARFVPVLRQAISIPAGIAKMSYAKFIGYTVLASVIWSILFIYLGDKLAANWSKVDTYAKPLLEPLMIIGFLVIIGYVIFSISRRKKKI